MNASSFTARLLLALLILVVDAVIFIIPLAAFFLAYVIVARPRRVKEWVDRLYA